MPATRALFPTLIYCDQLKKSGLARYNDELADEIARIRDYDEPGRTWSEENYPGGYTSYASLCQLHHFSSSFADLEKSISRHVRAFVKALELDVRGREVFMTDCWVNIMPTGTTHGMHLHPLSFVSGTYYVRTPKGCPGLKFEDPRLDRFMAAPPRRLEAREENRAHVTYPAEAGNVVLFESWIRHEVPTNRMAGERVSVSFNYNWR